MSAAPHRPAHNRPALIALVVVVFVGCLALAWWQWERFESASGTGQNLGYALQWPLFAAFAVFAYVRFVRLEREAEEPAAPLRAKEAPREIPAGILPERPTAAPADDPETVAYNQYLAHLHASDIETQVRSADLHSTERNAG
ncbi:transcriptional regulator [Nocardia rhizosphaerae]|uniref:Transcriptional regulator n=1 Tax=Nocardia rhizosphaerae TaxID=1691571 RepID=A0ABV8L3T3_9NOCA